MRRVCWGKCANLPQTTSKTAKKAKSNLDAAYSHLGGNAFGRDKKGRPTKEDLSGDFQAAGHGGEDFSPYVFYEFTLV